jgi:hypothetical protein
MNIEVKTVPAPDGKYSLVLIGDGNWPSKLLTGLAEEGFEPQTLIGGRRAMVVTRLLPDVKKVHIECEKALQDDTKLQLRDEKLLRSAQRSERRARNKR